MLFRSEHVLFCGSWLACDAGTSVHKVHRVDAIAGKPAPTFDRVRLCCCCCSGPYILFAGEVSGLLICACDRDLRTPPQITVGLRACRAIARHRVLGRRLFGYFCVFTKVTRRQGGTLSSRHPNIGYAPRPPSPKTASTLASCRYPCCDCDSVTSVPQGIRSAAIAGKPAPTEAGSHSGVALLSRR